MSNTKTYTMILNSNNVASSLNSIYQFNFIGGAFDIPPNSEICISSATIPYSWPNITSYYGNNTLTLNIPTAGVSNAYTQLPLIIPNGFYTQTSLNEYIQAQCIAIGFYLVNTTTGQNLYFFDLKPNAVYYSDQLFTFLVPTAANLATLYPGYRVPTVNDGGAAWWGFPITSITPQWNITNSKFGTVIGFSVGLYPPGPAVSNTANYNVLSNTFISTTVVNSLVFRSSLISNAITSPSDILDTMPIVNGVGYGSQLNYAPSFEKFVSIQPSKVTTMTLNIVDQNYNPIQMLDNNVCISLLIRTRIPIKTINFSN